MCEVFILERPFFRDPNDSCVSLSLVLSLSCALSLLNLVHTVLIDLAWGAREIHCGSVRPFGSVAFFKNSFLMQSVACIKKLINVQLFRQRIRRPIISRLCKYLPRVYWIHFAIAGRKKQKNSGRNFFLRDVK